MSIHGAGAGARSVPPYRFEQSVARVHATTPFEQEQQEPKLKCCKWNFVLPNGDAVTVDVHDQLTKGVRVEALADFRRSSARFAFGRAANPAQDSRSAQHQLTRGERFDHVIVCPYFKTNDSVHFFAAGSQHEHPGMRQRIVAPNAAAQLYAAGVGQHHIEYYEFVVASLQPPRCLLPGVRYVHAMTRGAQAKGNQVGNVGFVLNHEDGVMHGAKLARRSHHDQAPVLSRALVLAGAWVTTLFAWQASAQNTLPAEDLETPRGLALGTGLRASTQGGDALAYNIANLPLDRAYTIEAVSDSRFGDKQWSNGASLVDASTSPVAAGLNARGTFSTSDQGYKGFDGRLALAVPLGDVISLGIGGRFLSLRPQESLPEGSPPLEDNVDPRLRRVTLEAAARVTLFKILDLSVTGANLVRTESPLAPQRINGSAAFRFGSGLSLGGDVLADLSTLDSAAFLAGGGIEYLAAGVAPLRLGYRYDEIADAHAMGFGVGYKGSAFSAEVGLLQEVTGSKATRVTSVVGYRVR